MNDEAMCGSCGNYPHVTKGLCKSCYDKNRMRTNPEARAKRDAGKKNHRATLQGRYYALQYRSKKKGLELSLTMADLDHLLKQPCAYCRSTEILPSGFRLDRKDNTKGYTHDNVVPCCDQCNYLRGDILTVAETHELAKALVQFRKKPPMNRQQYLAYHKECCDKMIAITEAKNHDYCGEGDDPFANFSKVDHLGITSVERGFLTRMSDKFCRLITFVQKGVLQVKDESVDDTLLDLANYCILMSGYIASKRQS